MADMCAYCQTDTAGNHDSRCPIREYGNEYVHRLETSPISLSISVTLEEDLSEQEWGAFSLFVETMRAKLKANQHKGGWQSCDVWWLLERLREEVNELHLAIENNGDVLGEAADVANFAMMIADKMIE